MKEGPALVHVVTKKGKGYPPAEAADDKYHGVSAFDVITGVQAKPKTNAPSYTRVFANALIDAAQRDDKIVAITAAMPEGTGLDGMKRVFPERVFDVGIAEQHAVTFSAGLAERKAISPRSARSVRPSCSAATTRSCTTWRSRNCRSALRSIAPGWSAPMARRMPALSMSRISPACRT